VIAIGVIVVASLRHDDDELDDRPTTRAMG
jgi:hypothetical protein